MPYFEVTRRKTDDPARTDSQNYEAPNADVARQEAAVGGWTVTGVRPLAAKPASYRRTRVRPLSGKGLIRFCRSVGSMLNATISMSDSLGFYADGLEDPALKTALLRVKEKINTGSDTADAFAGSGRFDDMFVGLIRAGASAGILGEAFRSVAKFAETSRNFRARLKKALAMPVVAIFIVTNVFVYAQVIFIPQIEKMLSDFKQEPDPFSKVVFAVSHVTRTIWPIVYLLALTFILTMVFSTNAREAVTRFVMSKWKLLRNMIMGLRQLLVIGTMEMLVKNRIPVVEAVRSAARVVRGTPMEGELEEVARRYQTGSIKLGEGFARLTSCDRAVAHMIGAGESTATLDTQLGLLASMYEEQTGDAMDAFVQIASFATLLIACVLIGFTFIGSMLPVVLMGPKLMSSGFR